MRGMFERVVMCTNDKPRAEDDADKFVAGGFIQ